MVYNDLVKKVTNEFVKKTDYDDKITEIEGQLPSITSLATTTSLIAVKNAITSVNDIYNKIKIDNLCITLTDYNKFTKDTVDTKLKQAKLGTKCDIADFAKKVYINEKLININKKVTLTKKITYWFKAN